MNRISTKDVRSQELDRAIEVATSGLKGMEAVCTANAIKFLWNWKLKDGAQDLERARWYIDKLIQTQAQKEDKNGHFEKN